MIMKKNVILLMMLFLSLSATADDSGTCGNNATYTYNANTHTLTISGTGNMHNYMGENTRPWQSYANDISSVVINSGITSIGDFAFIRLTQLSSVSISNSVKSIGSTAFYGCSNLTSITIPSSVKSIDFTSFNACTNLSTIKVESGNTVYDSRSNCNGIIKTSTNTLLTGCKNTVIPNTVTAIGTYAFYNCNSLSSIIIPSSINSIASSAFYGCDGLKTVVIPNSVTSMGSSVFSNCSGLKEITLSENLTSIKSSVFLYCVSLKSINIPRSVTSIENSAFYGCQGLTSITVDKQNTYYDSRDNCNAIIETASNKLIIGCSSTVIPNSIIRIDEYAFIGCNNSAFILPSSIASIGNYAFAFCDDLKDLYLYAEEPPIVDSNTFTNTQNITLHVPAASVAKYLTSSMWKDFGTIVALTDSDPKPTNVRRIVTNHYIKDLYYDLQGRPFRNPRRGLFILNGIKVVVPEK